MIMWQWHTATTTRDSYTLTYQFFTDLQTFDYRVALRIGLVAMVRLVRPWPYQFLRESGSP